MASYILKNGVVFAPLSQKSDISLFNCGFDFVGSPSGEGQLSLPTVLDISGCVVFPGFTDVHVHFREPGFSYKETIKSGSSAAARGGYTTVCTMPNLSPVPDSLENLTKELDIIKSDSKINILPYGAITVGEKGEALSAMEDMAPYVVAFSDDGRGVQSEEMMLLAMQRAKKLDKIIVAHCEDNSLLQGGYIHDGEYARLHSHRGICSESEWKPIERDLHLAARTGCKYHVCHISCKESVRLIREAKKAGVDVTCETAPHYLLLDESNLKEDGRYKMNPPLRSKADREALIEGICDGTIDMIATDHAPHSKEEKSRGLERSLMGVVGLESAFPLLYTFLVKKGIIDIDMLIRLLTLNPNERFNINSPFNFEDDGNFTVFDLEKKYVIDPSEFLTMGRSTPFEGFEVYGRCRFTVAGGKIAWRENLTEN